MLSCHAWFGVVGKWPASDTSKDTDCPFLPTFTTSPRQPIPPPSTFHPPLPPYTAMETTGQSPTALEKPPVIQPRASNPSTTSTT
ncbi:hypothetical protein SODALDRAFT_357018 [Sodiomyces alkalinus F11]|uniref:Uncharacterized protein n=1 Tax=Sodiomyces alkalinus (strain CBS 110278 / VKM F-3762 / F11) TaxID=1314773 RepID=A0A3N2Q2N6_SODAK|nr:hypothetical protein SODALDRAFT_357018 [Sodiomyces alkalinus F11]ROT40992.1 hypothetical protein SODALDRAFT_357018 [Sodiomyces alkalinus F11]